MQPLHKFLRLSENNVIELFMNTRKWIVAKWDTLLLHQLLINACQPLDTRLQLIFYHQKICKQRPTHFPGDRNQKIMKDCIINAAGISGQTARHEIASGGEHHDSFYHFPPQPPVDKIESIISRAKMEN